MPQQSPRSHYLALTVALRPPRVVVVFDGTEDWVSQAALAMHQCTKIWGGSGFILIPHSNGKVDDALRRMAQAYDPDYVVCSRVTHSDYEAMFPDRLRFFEDDVALQGEDRSKIFETSGSFPLHNAASFHARSQIASDCTPHRILVDDNTRVSEPSNEQVFTLEATDHGPFLASGGLQGVGALETVGRGVPSDFSGMWALAAAMNVGFGEAPRLPFSEQILTNDRWRTLAREAIRPPSEDRYRDLFEASSPSWRSAWDAALTGVVGVHTWRTKWKPRLVVVGDSATDFALAYAWKVLFGKAHWIPAHTLPLSGAVVDATRSLGRDIVRSENSERSGSIIVSETLPLDALETLCQHWVDENAGLSVVWDGEQESVDVTPKESKFECGTADKLDWKDGGLLVIQNQYALPLSLPASENQAGDIDILVDLPPITPSNPSLQGVPQLTWQIDLEYAYPNTPRMRSVNPREFISDGRFYEAVVRSSRTGITCYSASYGLVHAGATQIQAMARPKLRIPGLMTWVRSMAKGHDLQVDRSTAGRRVHTLTRIWGAPEILAQDWSGPLRPALLAFQTASKSTSDAFPSGGGVVLPGAGAFLSFEGMLQTLTTSGIQLTPHELRDNVDRLCTLGALQRGLILNCEECADKRFIRLRALSDMNECVRCGALNPLTAERWKRIPEHEPQWLYDLHPAARDLLAADGGIALLCSNHLRGNASAYSDLPEIEFSLPAGEQVAEVDIIASIDGGVLIGEAKTTPKLGSGRALTAKCRKLAMMAHVLRADQVLLCTSSDSPWSEGDIRRLQSTLDTKFEHDPWQPQIRLITGLGTDSVHDEIAPGAER